MGIRPKNILTEQRIEEILDGIKRYTDKGKSCPVEWIRELSQLNNSLDRKQVRGELTPEDRRREDDFVEELSSLLNRYGKDNATGTPDFVLAEYLEGCLKVYGQTLNSRGLFLKGGLL